MTRRSSLIVTCLGCLWLPTVARADELAEPVDPVDPPAEPAATEPEVPATTREDAVTAEPAAARRGPDAGAPAPSASRKAPSDAAPPGATAFMPWPIRRLYVELELTTQARMTRRAGDDLSELRLDRGELGGWFGLGRQAAAELRVETIRSAVDGGSLGIDGDSTVIRLKTAQLLGSHAAGRLILDGAFGFVPDPWIATLEGDYTVKPLSRTGSERMLGWPTSDLSGRARVAYGPVRATVAIGNGEGLQFPERNTGKTTTAVLEVVPIVTPTLRITVAAVVRDGSIGVASIRDRRYGGGVVAVTPWVRGGGDVVIARGIGDRGAAEGTLISGWADARVFDLMFIAARGSSLGFTEGGGRRSTFGGGLAIEPWRDRTSRAAGRGRFRIWLAVDRVTASGGAMPIPGADAGDATLVMLIASAIAPFTLE